jgi:formate--tetrahydrofolate ligase
MNGGVQKDDLSAENVEALTRGCSNLGRHVANVRKFGVPVVVAINHFISDTDAEIEAVKDYVARLGAEAIVCRHWGQGSAGIEELAYKVVELADSGQAAFQPLYPDDTPLMEKIEIVASKIYHAGEVTAEKAVRDQLKSWQEQGYGNLPVCIAKTQYSFSTDPSLRGAPEGHVVHVREVRLSAGAGFIVAITGEIMTMPGLPRSPSAERIMLNAEGQIEGLF